MTPVPAVVTAAMPAAVMTVPMPVSMAPAHFFGLETVRFVFADVSGTRVFVRGRQPPVRWKRMRRKRRGMGARGQCGGAGGKSKGEFQKVAAFHDVLLFVSVE
jgi:hypothetical protein